MGMLVVMDARMRARRRMEAGVSDFRKTPGTGRKARGRSGSAACDEASRVGKASSLADEMCDHG